MGSGNGRLFSGTKGDSNPNKNLNFSNKAAQHMGEKGRHVPVQTLRDAIKYGKALPDPRGSSDAKMYYIKMDRNGKSYDLEVLYDEKTNTIYHFKYSRLKIIYPILRAILNRSDKK